MRKLILYFVLAALIAIFGSQNMTVVPIHLVVGSPLNVPLIVVMAMSVFIGYAAAVFILFFRAARTRMRKKARNELSGSRPPARRMVKYGAGRSMVD